MFTSVHICVEENSSHRRQRKKHDLGKKPEKDGRSGGGERHLPVARLQSLAMETLTTSGQRPAGGLIPQTEVQRVGR